MLKGVGYKGLFVASRTLTEITLCHTGRGPKYMNRTVGDTEQVLLLA